jgi:uncharacterized membrane protein (UPF0127 family)
VRCFVFVALLTACSTSTKHDDGPIMPVTTDPPKPTQPSAKVYVGDVPVNVEVVSTDAKIERGLMYRQHLPPDDGMLFMLPVERDWTFWMRNTLIPLDMLFIKRDLTVAGIVENAEPKTESLRRVGIPTVYVLEVNGGWAAQHHITAGAKVRFENIPNAR